MKRLILGLLVLSLTTLFTHKLSAQDQSRVTPHHTEQQNYVVLTRKIPQLKPILLTAEHFKQEDGAAFGDFRVIVCGQDVDQLTDAATMDPFLKQAEALGVKIVACGFSLNKFGVDRAAVPAAIEIVENGIQYNFTLQKNGYYSISL
ncbi:intracellular sulfur oxidation DsrE/DsrF family protein [Lewinella marina]|uniref:Sulfur reduction protein DsrE n=1 Tax=Neolewinella marina TaxID=438751 RepID=A0A2G0CGK4_9BACT|nr:sulfur reduction protein DsrE [Neolewinella marina]NJB86420.1 intracellular sulfur oxidation DsrE/DsrF family protein [Neolewinella marina]PHK99115.1 sulfur reduction protein DsrE [Neolewinella marina]